MWTAIACGCGGNFEDAWREMTASNPLPCREQMNALQWVEHRSYMRRKLWQKRWQREHVKMRRRQLAASRTGQHFLSFLCIAISRNLYFLRRNFGTSLWPPFFLSHLNPAMLTWKGKMFAVEISNELFSFLRGLR